MILADKIVRLRKKNGWSQEELAQKMNVSRQAVSKWESAQTVPELEKILQLGALFGVTTDYLLKDDMELEEFTSETIDSGVRQISIEEAGTYLVQSRESAKRIAVGTFLCVLSPIPLLVGAFSEQEFLITLLLTVTMVLAGIGACIFVVNCSIWTSMQKLLKEGDYTMEAKRKNRKMGGFSVVYWLILTAIYLAWSFSTNTWDKTWIVYVVGGVIYAALCVVWELVMNREK